MNYAARRQFASVMVEKLQIERYQSIAMMQGLSTPACNPGQGSTCHALSNVVRKVTFWQSCLVLTPSPRLLDVSCLLTAADDLHCTSRARLSLVGVGGIASIVEALFSPLALQYDSVTMVQRLHDQSFCTDGQTRRYPFDSIVTLAQTFLFPLLPKRRPTIKLLACPLTISNGCSSLFSRTPLARHPSSPMQMSRPISTTPHGA